MGGLVRQVSAVVSVCLVSTIIGILMSWPSSAVAVFTSENTPLNRQMTTTEISLLGSLSSIGAMISTPLGGFLIDRLGRKKCIIMNAILYVICWSIISVAARIELILTASFIGGLGGGILTSAPVYINEICQESIQGAMTCLVIVFFNLGMLLAYIFGGYTSYETTNYFALGVAAFVVVMNVTLLKETPVFLLQKGLEKEAYQTMAYFRGESTNSKAVQEEMAKLQRSLDADGEEELPEEEENLKKDSTEKKPKEKLSVFQFLKKSRSSRRAIMVCLVLCTASILQGLLVVQVYAEVLFKQAAPHMSTALCTIIFAVVSLCAGLSGGYLCEASGRKGLMMYASLATGVCCVLLGSQLQLSWAPAQVSAVLLYLYTIAFTLGAGTLPYVFITEMFLPEIKSFATAVVIEWAWMCNFTVLFIFNPLLEVIGMGPIFYIFAVVCFLSALFCVFFVPETKGHTVEEIQSFLLGKRRRKSAVP